MKTKSITGKVVHQNLGIGFWGIESDGGKQLRPVNMPGALQKEGIRVKVSYKEAEEQMSIFMWGTAIKITNYTIVG